MEEATGSSGVGIHWLWAVASAGQMGWGVRSYLKGYPGDSCLMPLKAFTVASLFIGSAASASIFILQSNGIHGVDDLIGAGANLRAKLGLRPRTPNKNLDES
ncbi:uncharacterized protein LOC131611526 [Vicia villosa]|uniref:uncharacterized protein LOC131611526 n=1 Tax=Vicia villosa TaxID=3911 RepID=UPI00273ABF19|nr:uncharacterized protein LOC131611526 [Vicia villosa]